MATTRVHDLITIASRLTGISEAAIVGQQRFGHIVRVRQAVAHVAVNMGIHSTPQIGRAIGGRDHSTIIHANRKATILAERDPEYAHFIQRIKDEAAIAEPFLRDWGEQYEFALPRIAEPVVIPSFIPKPDPVEEEEFYYGGGYSMNREAAA